MKVFGCVRLNDIEQRRLSEGALFDFPMSRLYTLLKSKPSVGDLLWVKEHFVVITSNKAWLQGTHGVFPGPRTGFEHIPPELRSTDYKRKFRDAEQLARSDSRATMVILNIANDGPVHCQATMVQADKLREAEGPPR